MYHQAQSTGLYLEFTPKYWVVQRLCISLKILHFSLECMPNEEFYIDLQLYTASFMAVAPDQGNSLGSE